MKKIVHQNIITKFIHNRKKELKNNTPKLESNNSKFCSKCGTKANIESSFCPSCGEELKY